MRNHPKKSFGICTLHTFPRQLSYELFRVYQEAQKLYDDVLLINPRRVSYLFVRDTTKPVILYQDTDISSLDTLLVRSTKNSEAAIAILVRSLKSCGCDILDPMERFSVGKASKLLTTISRFQRGLGTSTYISFTRPGAQALLRKLEQENRFPLLSKPVAGRRGEGVELIGDRMAGLDCIDRYFGAEEYLADPFYFQDFVQFQREYRVLVIDGEAIGVVEKRKPAGQLTANAAQGGVFVAVEAPEVVRTVLQNVSHEGALGVDVAIDQDSQVHIIETNRAPQWQAFEEATGLNVAKILVERALNRQNRRK
ncbi:hypothetical protein GCM10027299_06530 [Larkinella ripae]